MHTQGSVEIDRPIDEVYWLTVDNVAEWSKIVVEDETLVQTPEMIGSTFRTVTFDRGQRMEFEGTITKFEPPKIHAVEMTGKMFDLEVEYLFEDLGSRTRVTQNSIVHPKGGMKIFFALLGWAMKKSSCDAIQKELEGLKRFCENADAAVSTTEE